MINSREQETSREATYAFPSHTARHQIPLFRTCTSAILQGKVYAFRFLCIVSVPCMQPNQFKRRSRDTGSDPRWVCLDLRLVCLDLRLRIITRLYLASFSRPAFVARQLILQETKNMGRAGNETSLSVACYSFFFFFLVAGTCILSFIPRCTLASMQNPTRLTATIGEVEHAVMFSTTTSQPGTIEL